MPEITPITLVVSAVVVLLLVMPFVAARIRTSSRHHSIKADGPGPGFTYALVPPGGHPDASQVNQQGSWQWCLAFIPDDTEDGGSAMPPWWAPAPPWNVETIPGEHFTQDADALCAVFEETSTYPNLKSTGS